MISRFNTRAFSILRGSLGHLTSVGKVDEAGTHRVRGSFGRGFNSHRALTTLVGGNLARGRTLGTCGFFGSGTTRVFRSGPFSFITYKVVDFSEYSRLAIRRKVTIRSAIHTRTLTTRVIRRGVTGKRAYLPQSDIMGATISCLSYDRSTTRVTISSTIRGRHLVGRRVSKGRFLFAPRTCGTRRSVTSHVGIVIDCPPHRIRVFRDRIFTFRDSGGVTFSRGRHRTVRVTIGGNVLVLANNPNANGAAAIGNVVALVGGRKLGITLTTPANETTGEVARLANYRTGALRHLLRTRFGSSRGGSSFTQGEGGPLRTSTIVVSRLSVISVFLFSSLLSTLPLRSELVLINSGSRLPPINTKGILSSLQGDNLVPIIRLSGVFHRTVRDEVIAGTREIIHNRVPMASSGSPRSSFFLIRRRSPCATSNGVTSLIAHHLPRTCNFSSINSVRILYPSHVNRLNSRGVGQVLRGGLGPPTGNGHRVAIHNCALHRNSGIVRVGGGCSIP